MTIYDLEPHKIEIEIYGGLAWKVFINGKEIIPYRFAIDLCQGEPKNKPITYIVEPYSTVDIFDGNKRLE